MGCFTARALLTIVAAAPGVVAQTYEDGPNVPDAAINNRLLCNSEFGTLGQAMALCNANTSCLTLHDFACDGQNWRTCSATISDLQDISPDRSACTMIRTFGYVEGPRVGNNVIRMCNPPFDGLQPAILLCEEDLACQTLHDFACDGQNWRTCSATISQLQDASSDTLACTRFRPTTTISATVTSATTSLSQTSVTVTTTASTSVTSATASTSQTSRTDVSISLDCETEFANAMDTGDFTNFCARCSSEEGNDPLRTRCPRCSEVCNP